MQNRLTQSYIGKNVVYIGLRALMIVAFSVLIYLVQPRMIVNFPSIEDIAIPAIIGVLSIVLLLGMLAVPSLRVYAPYLIMPGDWLLVASYVYYAPANNTLLIVGIVSMIVISGVLRLGTSIGAIEAGGVIIASLIAAFLSPRIGLALIEQFPTTYLVPLLFIVLAAVIASTWANTLDDENGRSNQSVRKEIEEARRRLENMRERARSVVEMATALNSTLNYDRILDAALDAGRISLRIDARHRTVSLAIMVVTQDELEIAGARGLQFVDQKQRFKGIQGIIADAINEGMPVVVNGGERDPELGKLKAFAGIKTTACIPLRANLETYGVLVFASTAEQAIHEDHIDTLAAIGVQVTIALQNAVLYGNLRDEKERIIRIEENGRKALVRDLHDIPTQTISTVAMRVSTLPMILQQDPQRFRSEVEMIHGMAVRATEEIRHVMFTLRPLSLETQGLGAALDQLSQKMQTTYGQAVQVKIDLRIEQVLNQEAQGTLFYLIEEAANNARKYASAPLIQVQGIIQDDSVIVRIRDNGKGFDTDLVSENYEGRGSFGMVNMRERAELINGTFELQSAPNKGTLITVRVPIEADRLPALQTEQPATVPRRSLRKQYSGPMSPST
jgi:signal transduction histidine kinase